MSDTLVLADFSNLAYRPTREAQSGYALARRALLRVQDAVETFCAEAAAAGDCHVAFVFDPDPEPSPRFAGPPEELRVPHARALLRELGYPVYQLEPHSADDIIIALAAEAERHFDQVFIVSHDRDLISAVSDRTSLVRKWGVEPYDVWTGQRRRGYYGVEPEQWNEVRALGAAPWTYGPRPAVEGKTSRALITRFGSLNALYAHLDEVEPEGLRRRLAEAEGDVRARLANCAPIELPAGFFDPAAGRLGQPLDSLPQDLLGLDRGSLLSA